jgi:HPt (histidine-containing phosphotransfer) domain-containing protein
LPPIVDEDFNTLLELLGPETMRDVVRLLMDSAPTRFSSARAGLAEGDTVRAATAFHTLRSSCGQLGAKALEQLCIDGERHAKAGDVPSAAAALADAEREFARCVEWFGARGFTAPA